MAIDFNDPLYKSLSGSLDAQLKAGTFGANTGAPAFGGSADEEVRARLKAMRAMRAGAVPATPAPGGAPPGVTGSPPPVGGATPSGGPLSRLLGGASRLFSPVATGASAGLLGYEAGQAGVEAIADASLRASNRLGPAGVEFLKSGQYDARPETIQAAGFRTPAKFGAEVQDTADAKVRGLQEQTAARTARVNEVIAASQAARGADVVFAREASPVFPRGPSSYGDAFRFLMDLGRYKTQVKDQNEAITERRLQEAARSKYLEAGIAANSKVIPIKGADMSEGAVQGDRYIRPDPKAPGELAVSKVPAPKNEVKFGPGLDPGAVKRSAEAHVKANPGDKAEINRQLRASGYKFQI